MLMCCYMGIDVLKTLLICEKKLSPILRKSPPDPAERWVSYVLVAGLKACGLLLAGTAGGAFEYELCQMRSIVS